MSDLTQISAYSAIYDDSALARIDVEAGIIRGVSVITEGPALGHGAFVDAVTVQQVVDRASEYAGGVRVNNDHGSDLFNAAGFLRNFRSERRNGTLRAVADLHILESETNRAKLLELASTIPDTFGISVVMGGLHEKREGRTYLRCDELLSADLVPEPAANPTGLFSRPKTKTKNLSIMTNEEIEAAIGEAIEARMSALEKSVEEMKGLMLPKDDEELASLKEEVESLKSNDGNRMELAAKAFAKEFSSLIKLNKAAPGVTPPVEETPKEVFEDKVISLRKGGKSKGEAISLASRENPDLHRDYISRLQAGNARSIEA
jgi:hypothetical protein